MPNNTHSTRGIHKDALVHCQPKYPTISRNAALVNLAFHILIKIST
jgi:hypothetical protein